MDCGQLNNTNTSSATLRTPIANQEYAVPRSTLPLNDFPWGLKLQIWFQNPDIIKLWPSRIWSTKNFQTMDHSTTFKNCTITMSTITHGLIYGWHQIGDRGPRRGWGGDEIATAGIGVLISYYFIFMQVLRLWLEQWMAHCTYLTHSKLHPHASP